MGQVIHLRPGLHVLEHLEYLSRRFHSYGGFAQRLRTIPHALMNPGRFISGGPRRMFLEIVLEFGLNAFNNHNTPFCQPYKVFRTLH